MAKFDWNQFPTEDKAPQKSGGKFDWNQFPVEGPSKTESALRQFASGAVGSFDDEITGALGAAGRVFGYKNLGSWKPFDPNSHLEKANDSLSSDALIQAYRDNRDAIREQQGQDMATNPKTTIAANLTGAIASPIAKIGASGQVAQTASRAQKLAQAMKTGASQGAIFGAGASNADLTKGEVGQFVTDTALGAGTGALIPPALQGTVAAAGKGAQAAGWAGKKMFSSLFGVTEDNASQYLARRQAINAAPELAHIKDGVDAAVQKIAEGVDSGKLQVEQAQAALSDLKTQVRNQLVDGKVDAREAARRAEDLFKESAARLIQPIKDTPAPTNIASHVVNAVEDLKSGLSQKSGQAWETLEKSDKTLPTSVVKGALTNAINSMKVGGSEGGAVGQASESAIASLKNLSAQLDTLPEHLSMPQVKQIVQNLDRDIAWKGAAGEFMDPASQEKLGIRRTMDSYLKGNIPEYAQAMAPVSKDAQLLNQVSSAFGDERKAIGRLGQIAGPKGTLDRQALSQLEQATGRPGAFTNPVDQFTRAQSILKDPQALDQMKRALPEYAEYRQAAAKLAKMNPQWTRDQLEQALSKSKEARNLALAEDAFSKARDKFEPVSSLNQNSTQSKLESFLKPKGAPIETARALQSLDEASGNNFTQKIKDRGVLDSFDKPYTHGSRNTVLWSVIGLVFGGLPGAAGGATMGQLVDRYGPKVGKSILDGVGKIRENPTVQTIRSLNIPEGVKNDLEREFNVYMIMRNNGEVPRKVANSQGQENRSPATGEDKWAQQGIQKLGIQDDLANRLMQDPKAKQLLIQASDLKPGSKAMNQIMDRIKKGWGQR